VHPYLRTRLGLQMFLAGAVFGAYQPVLPPYLKSLGFSEFQCALALASSNIATMISPIMVGQAADRWIASERLLARRDETESRERAGQLDRRRRHAHEQQHAGDDERREEDERGEPAVRRRHDGGCRRSCRGDVRHGTPDGRGGPA